MIEIKEVGQKQRMLLSDRWTWIGLDIASNSDRDREGAMEPKITIETNKGDYVLTIGEAECLCNALYQKIIEARKLFYDSMLAVKEKEVPIDE